MTKIEALTCPLCKSTHVSKDFSKRRGRAFVVTDKLYCYNCDCSINLKTLKTARINYREYNISEKQDQLVKRKAAKDLVEDFEHLLK